MSKKMSKIKKKMQELNITVKPDDIVMDYRGHTYVVKSLKKDGVEIGNDEENDDGELEWCHYGTIDYERFTHDYRVLDKPIEQYEQDLVDVLQDPDVLLRGHDVVQDSNALMVQDKKGIMSMHKTLQDMEHKVGIMYSMLESKKEQLYGIMHHYRDAIERVSKVIGTIELYLGVDEDIVQITKGQPADSSEPISIRQLVLYMDEEFADTQDQGLDFRSIDKFDQWLTSDPKRYDKLLPEQKGVVVLRVRRSEKEYTKNAFTNMLLNQKNMMTYLLIRNGQNFYRIWANINLGERMFPTRDELEERPDDYFYSQDLEDRQFNYKQKAMLLQGLIDRSQVFDPKPPGINLFKQESHDKHVRLIKDAEYLLPDGRLSFADWKSKINGTIDVGTRILWVASLAGYKTDNTRRYVRYYANFPPDMPHTGVYNVVGKVEHTDYFGGKAMWFKILYNPRDTVYGGWGQYHVEPHERKQRVGMLFLPRDHHILNYDAISLDDVEFYLESRVDRPNYLSMMPVLRTIRKERLKEIEHERQFVEALVGREFGRRHDYEKVKHVMWKTIDWWKTKVKMKRPLDQDDAKAWRMIKSKVTKSL